MSRTKSDSNKAVVALVAVLVITLLSFTPALPALASDGVYTLPGDAVFPEGIAYQQSTGDFFVSSSSTGTIFRANVNDEAAQPFLPGGSDGRASALGLRVDGKGRLFVAGGVTGMIFVYDVATKNLIGKFSAGTPQQSLVNDGVVTPSGDAYFTDSFSPVIYRVTADADGKLAFERFLELAGTAVEYKQGATLVESVNLNGIVVTPDGKYLIVCQTNASKLFRIGIADKSVTPIDLVGSRFGLPDGLLLQGQTLYAVTNLSAISTIRMSADYASGTLVSYYTDPSFAFPTGIALSGDEMLVVNSQLDKQGEGLTPNLPFTVTKASLPAITSGMPGASSTPGMPTTGLPGDALLVLELLGLSLAFMAVGMSVRRYLGTTK